MPILQVGGLRSGTLNNRPKVPRLLGSRARRSCCSDSKLSIKKILRSWHLFRFCFVFFFAITSWQIDGEKVEARTDFFVLGFKITVDVDCSHEIKNRLLLGRKAMTSLDSILKSRDICLPTKVHIVKTAVFRGVTYGCGSWTIKKAEHWKTGAFKLWSWRRFWGVPWISRRTKQSILKKINPEYSLEGLMLKLRLQNFGHLMWRADLLGKTLMLGKIEGRRRKGRQRMRW